MITPEEICTLVEENRDEAIRCLQEIVQTPSVTGNELEVSQVFAKWIEDCGLIVERYAAKDNRPNLIAQWAGSKPGKRFIFNGHMDVFPPTAGDDGWYGPWSGKIVDGYLYGRGSVDMKGGDCAALMAVRLLRKIGFDPKGSIVLSYMVDEENGGWHGVKYLISKGLLKGDFGICMEPTNGRILNQHRGRLALKFTYTAEPHHASTPHPSTDALKKAVTAINRLYELDASLAGPVDEFNMPTRCLSVTVLNAGNTANVQPSYAQFIVDRRVDMNEDWDQVKKQILDIFEDLKANDPEYEYTCELLSDRPPLRVPADDPFIGICLKSYEQIMKKPGKIYTRSGGSDAASLNVAYGLAMPNWGAAPDFDDEGKGDPYGSGTVNERLNIQSYLDSIKYYMMTVVNALS